jgi:hypothetical protein
MKRCVRSCRRAWLKIGPPRRAGGLAYDPPALAQGPG